MKARWLSLAIIGLSGIPTATAEDWPKLEFSPTASLVSRTETSRLQMNCEGDDPEYRKMTCRFHQVSIRPPEEQGPADMQAIATLKPLKKKEFWRRVNWYCMMNAKDPAEYGEPDGRRQLLQHRLQNWQKVCECKTRECVLEHRTG